ncbi:MAG: hypothetical protein B7X99_05195 [Rhizobiales bacterium 17-65-6]|nr:MAG: hypothetical protein B7X99_05195 [Rhizobiales bacterium 17-65-6]
MVVETLGSRVAGVLDVHSKSVGGANGVLAGNDMQRRVIGGATVNALGDDRSDELEDVGTDGAGDDLGSADLLDQVLDGKTIDPMAAIREPVIVHEATPIFRVLDQFKKAPVRLAIVIDEYGALEGIVTQTDLLEAIAGDLPDAEGEDPDIVEREDGSLLIDGMMPAHDAFARLGFKLRSADGDFHTIAGFALARLGHLPEVSEHFDYEGWRFEVIDMDGRRIDKLLARREHVEGS